AALTVGATGRSDAISSFSNHGTCVDLFAPGEGIASAWYRSTTGWAPISGTSMAAPHVAGAAALLLAAVPPRTPAQVSAALLADTTPGLITALPAGTANRLLHVPPPIEPPPPPPPPPVEAPPGSLYVP